MHSFIKYYFCLKPLRYEILTIKKYLLLLPY
jgi:hypothetical protein